MSEPEKKTKKEALKQLRKERSGAIEKIREINTIQKKIIKDISEQLTAGKKTVPELAGIINLPSSQVLLYLASLMEYGVVAEAEKEGDYFKYELVSG